MTLAALVLVTGMALAATAVVSGLTQYLIVASRSRDLRKAGVNGEVLLAQEVIRRNAAVLVCGALLLLAAMGAHVASGDPMDADDAVIVGLAAMHAWLGERRLRDRRQAELYAAQRFAREDGHGEEEAEGR